MNSSDDDGDRRMPFTLWCLACAHAMHTTAHGVRHRRLCRDTHGFLCGCCGETFNWRALTAHLNQTGAHLRPPCWHVAPLPMTDRLNRSCCQTERENRGRMHPYARPPPSTVPSPACYRRQDPMWSSATVDPPITQPAQFSCGTGFGSPPPLSPGSLMTDLAVASSPYTTPSWTYSIPSASWTTLGTDVTLTSAADDDDDTPLSERSAASSTPHRSRMTSSAAASSVISIGSGDTSNVPPTYTTDTPPLHSAAAVHCLDALSVPLSERDLNAALITQIVWLAEIVKTHVPQLPPDDLADEAGRRLMQARGHWLVSVPNPMEVPLQQLLRLMFPVWRHLLRHYSPQ